MCIRYLLMTIVVVKQITQQYYGLTNLYIKDNNIGEEGAKELRNTQTISILNTMRISTCASDLLMMKVRIHQCTQQYYSVTNLYLKDNHIGEEGAKELRTERFQYHSWVKLSRTMGLFHFPILRI